MATRQYLCVRQLAVCCVSHAELSHGDAAANTCTIETLHLTTSAYCVLLAKPSKFDIVLTVYMMKTAVKHSDSRLWMFTRTDVVMGHLLIIPLRFSTFQSHSLTLPRSHCFYIPLSALSVPVSGMFRLAGMSSSSSSVC